jgi:N-ethylmaleimide reductase
MGGVAENIEMLFEPFQLGSVTLANRLVMAPMTRHRATLEGVPTDLAVDYYRQRASAGLIITEGTYPEAMGRGYLFTPGLCTPDQVAGWRRVTDAVHEAGGRIFCQLMHCGRLSDPLILPGNAEPVAPSAVQPGPNGLYTLNCPRPNRPYPRPRALTTGEVYEVIDGYRLATENAVAAGFDGVEIHAGNGYLPMQFFATNVNLREDEFGGSVQGRCRFILALAEAMASVRGGGFVGLKIQPGQSFADVHDDDPIATYTYAVPELSRLGLAYLHLSQRPVGWDVPATLRPLFDGPVIGGSGFARGSAAAAIARGVVDLVAFGQAFLANPDLVERYRNGSTVNRPDLETYYSQGAQGYTDYPVHAARDPARQSPADLTFVSALQAERSDAGA